MSIPLKPIKYLGIDHRVFVVSIRHNVKDIRPIFVNILNGVAISTSRIAYFYKHDDQFYT